jgi:Flp pilus assembly protein TadD
MTSSASDAPSAAELLAIARAHEQAGRPAETSEAYAAVLALYPRNRHALVGLAQCHHARAEHARALDLFLQATASAPDDPYSLARAGQQQRLLGRPGDALATLEAATVRFPRATGPWVELAHTLQSVGRRDEAVDAWRHAAQGTPPSPQAVAEVATALTLRGDDAAALAFLDEPRAQAVTDHPMVRAARARVLLTLGRLDDARTAARTLDDGSPRGRAAAHEILGEIDFAAWEVRSSHDHLVQACLLEPTIARWDALAQVRMTLLDADGANEARTRWAELVRVRRTGRQPGDADVRATSGLLGDIVNEFRLSASVTAHARQAVADDDVFAARALVRQHPASLAAATALLVTMRRTGVLEIDPPAEATPAIPRTVVRAWFGSPPPADVLALGDLWAQTSPGWQVRLLDEEMAHDYLLSRHGERAAQAFTKVRLPAARADLFRLAWLAEQGGVWADADDRPLRSLDSIVTGRSLVVWQEERGNLGNNIIAAAPGHPVIQAALAEVVDNCIDGYTESTWLATGPGVLTRAFAVAAATDPDALLRGSAVLDRQQLHTWVAHGQPLAYKSTELNWQRA